MNSKSLTIPFGIVASIFSDNLSRNSCMQFPKRLFVFKISALNLRRKLEDGFTKTDLKFWGRFTQTFLGVRHAFLPLQWGGFCDEPKERVRGGGCCAYWAAFYWFEWRIFSYIPSVIRSVWISLKYNQNTTRWSDAFLGQFNNHCSHYANFVLFCTHRTFHELFVLKLTCLIKDWENFYHTARNATYLQYFVKLKSPKCDEVKEKVEKS